MRSACFTGHRNIKEDTAELEKRLYFELEKAITNESILNFYNGGSIGYDLLAASVVLRLKQKYPQIKLHMVLPCSPKEQSERWTDRQKSEYFSILRYADSIEQTSEHYYDDCMKVRNARLVELADCCFCYYDPAKYRSGTGQTVRMAERKGITIYNFYKKTARPLSQR